MRIGLERLEMYSEQTWNERYLPPIQPASESSARHLCDVKLCRSWWMISREIVIICLILFCQDISLQVLNPSEQGSEAEV